MRHKAFTMVLTFCIFAAGTCFAAILDPQIATWKLNPAKSKLNRQMGRNDLVNYEWSFFKIKVTISGVDARGNPVHSEWKGKFDGQDYPVSGDPTSDARAYRKVNDNTLDFTIKKGGAVVATGRIVVAPDGNSRTVTSWAKDARGKRITSVAVYNKVKLLEKTK
jgi:hypothetical protein